LILNQFAVQITSSNPDEVYRGILVQVRNSPEGEAFGQWNFISADFHPIDCHNKVESAVTHSYNNVKNFPIEAEWIPPSLDSGPYQV